LKACRVGIDCRQAGEATITEDLNRRYKMAEDIQKEGQEQADKPLEKLTVKELREIAKDIPDVTGIHSMKKDELIELVKTKGGGAAAAKPAAEAKPAAKAKKPAAKKAATKAPVKTLAVKELKALVAKLRQEKEEAREAKDRKQIDILRRQINRLKKQTRKAAAKAAPEAEKEEPEAVPQAPPAAAHEEAPEATA